MLPLLWSILFYLWFASEILIALLTRTRRQNTSASIQDRGSMLILWLVIFSSITACEWISAATQPTPALTNPWIHPLALITITLGLAIRFISVFSLGKAFSANVAIRASQSLNTTGLYRLVRHPSYLGLVLIFLAVGLHSRHALSLFLAVVPPTAALLYRIHIEELALNSAFGPEYALYSARTKRLLPGIY